MGYAKSAGRCVGTGALTVLLCASASGCAQEPASGASATTEEAPRAGYSVRLDSGRSDPGEFRLSNEGDELRILTGPAGIAYRPDDFVMSGDFRVDATFVQYGAPVGYREAYGIFVGGRDLQTDELEYTYFLIRPTGEYLVKRRLSQVTEVIVDWAPSAAIVAVREEGDEPRNTLSVVVEGTEARFLANGEVVHTMPASEARPFGIAGLRANHRLDVRVSDWMLEAGATGA